MSFITRLLFFLMFFCFVACDLPFTKDDPVIVSVGSSKLHLSEIKKQVNEWDNWDDQQRLRFLENWIDEETLFQEALENGTDKDPELEIQIDKTIRKMVVDHFLQKFSDTIVVGDAEKIDYYHAHPELFLRGKTKITGAFIYFRDYQSGNLYYKTHKNTKFDSIPEANYLIKKIEVFDSLTESPDTCLIQDINVVEPGVLSKMKFCDGSLKMSVVTLKLDSSDVLPYEEVLDDVSTRAWFSHREKVMDRLKKEWKMERPIFSKTDVFSNKDK